MVNASRAAKDDCILSRFLRLILYNKTTLIAAAARDISLKPKTEQKSKGFNTNENK